jgi:hypothetical protein
MFFVVFSSILPLAIATPIVVPIKIWVTETGMLNKTNEI